PTPSSLERAKNKADSVYNLVVEKKMPFSTAASLYSDDNETKFNGGMMLNAENVQSRTTHIPTDKLEPEVFLTVDTMKIGGYSKPALFTSREGKQGYRFFYLKSKTEPHIASLEKDYPKIKEAALEDKLNRTVSEWFEKRRLTTFIKIDPEYQSCPTLKLWVSAD